MGLNIWSRVLGAWGIVCYIVFILMNPVGTLLRSMQIYIFLSRVLLVGCPVEATKVER